jgi:hypothetical protein
VELTGFVKRVPEDDTTGEYTVPDEHKDITLDPTDPFESLLIEMVLTNRAKRADYATEANIFANFDYVANAMQLRQGGLNPLEVCNLLVLLKQGRINTLRQAGRPPRNEALDDTYKDRAVYSVLAWGILRRDAR